MGILEKTRDTLIKEKDKNKKNIEARIEAEKKKEIAEIKRHF